jgi:hypothetical protein
MYRIRLPWLGLLIVTAVYVTCPVTLSATDQPTPSKEQIKEFLLTAKVVKSHGSPLNFRSENFGLTNRCCLVQTTGGSRRC